MKEKIGFSWWNELANGLLGIGLKVRTRTLKPEYTGLWLKSNRHNVNLDKLLCFVCLSFPLCKRKLIIRLTSESNYED